MHKNSKSEWLDLNLLRSPYKRSDMAKTTANYNNTVKKQTFFGVVNNTIFALVVMTFLVLFVSFLGWRTGDSLNTDINGVVSNELQLLEESNLLAQTVSAISSTAGEYINVTEVSELGYWKLIFEDVLSNYYTELQITKARLESMEGFQLQPLMVEDVDGIEEHAEASVRLSKELVQLHDQYLDTYNALDKLTNNLTDNFAQLSVMLDKNANNAAYGPLERHLVPDLIRTHADVMGLLASNYTGDQNHNLESALKDREASLRKKIRAFNQQNKNPAASKAATLIEELVDGYYAEQGALSLHSKRIEQNLKRREHFKEIVEDKNAAIQYVGMLTGHANEQVDAASGSAAENFAKAVNYLMTLSGFSLLVAILIVIFLPKNIRTPLKLVSENLKQLSAGNLTRKVNYKKHDEFGLLTSDLNTMVDNLKQIIRQVKEGITAVKMEADRNTDSATTLSQSISSQRVETEGVAAAMTEMEASFQEVAIAAENTKLRSHDAKQAVQEGKDSIYSNTQEITALSERLQSVSEKIANVEDMSKTIGGIVQVIQNIAEQTNLLALNAAIEAARAGEQGRGFAVVADEVRSLASKTATSTSEIGNMINNLQGAVTDAVNEVSHSLEKMRTSTERNENTAQCISRIDEVVNEVVELGTQIALASGQQQETATEVAQKINQISSDTEKSQSAGEVLADISRSLDELADKQNSLVQQFKL